MKLNVLDHGYVELIEPWGVGTGWKENVQDYERGIIEAARQSTQGSFRGWADDEKLLAYLYNNKHSTPFEFAGMVIEVRAPLFVFREWHRHRTQSYNEASARYTPLPPLNYHISNNNLLARARVAATAKNRQASSHGELNEEAIKIWNIQDQMLSATLAAHYEHGLEIGVPKELARKKMPVDHYSQMRAHANLRNWLAFMTLRCDPAAQLEIREYAWAVAHIIKQYFPHTHQLWLDSP